MIVLFVSHVFFIRTWRGLKKGWASKCTSAERKWRRTLSVNWYQFFGNISAEDILSPWWINDVLWGAYQCGFCNFVLILKSFREGRKLDNENWKISFNLTISYGTYYDTPLPLWEKILRWNELSILIQKKKEMDRQPGGRPTLNHTNSDTDSDELN